MIRQIVFYGAGKFDLSKHNKMNTELTMLFDRNHREFIEGIISEFKEEHPEAELEYVTTGVKDRDMIEYRFIFAHPYFIYLFGHFQGVCSLIGKKLELK